jgi:hypothetical protein
MNPAAVPILKESQVILNLDKRIGELATLYPLTYYFGTCCNLIGIRLEQGIPGINEAGDLLIVQKGTSSTGKEKLVYDRATRKMFITLEACSNSERLCVVGDIIEERFNDNV